MREAQTIDEETQALMEIEGTFGLGHAKGEGRTYGAEKTGQGNYYRPNMTNI